MLVGFDVRAIENVAVEIAYNLDVGMVRENTVALCNAILVLNDVATGWLEKAGLGTAGRPNGCQ